MIAWWWLIPVFIAGGAIGVVILALWIADKMPTWNP